MNQRADKFAELDTAEHLYLRKLSEPRDNTLRIVVQEAISNRAKAAPLEIPGSPGKFFDGEAWPIESSEACRTFVLHWRHYVAYLVTEECVGSCGKYGDESFTGRLARLYTRSHHYKIVCLNHLIDVGFNKAARGRDRVRQRATTPA